MASDAMNDEPHTPSSTRRHQPLTPVEQRRTATQHQQYIQQNNIKLTAQMPLQLTARTPETTAFLHAPQQGPQVSPLPSQPALQVPQRRINYAPQQYQQTTIATMRPPSRFYLHPVFWTALVLLIMIMGYLGINWITAKADAVHDQLAYGYPRTYQCDAVVGHHDSTEHPSHFIALNLQGSIAVIEIQGGDFNKTFIYNTNLQFMNKDTDLAPVTLVFKDVNGDGKPDMIVETPYSQTVFLNDQGHFKLAK
jgi:hypothetical protein